MSLWRRVWSGSNAARAARAEAKGDLGEAAALWTEASRPDEAARVMVLRGDAETDVARRLAHYVQAASIAPAGGATQREARLKRAAVVLALHDGERLSAGARLTLNEAARDLEGLGELVRAAEAYARAGDAEGQARALGAAGEIDALEDLLARGLDAERGTRRRNTLGAELEMLVRSGRRREAVGAARAWVGATPDDAPIRERLVALEARRVLGPRVRLTLAGRPMMLVLGNEVIIGRSDADIVIPSTAVSRRHASLGRGPDGTPCVRDLGGRNGLQLRGMDVRGEVGVGDGIELRLGGEVRLAVTPSSALPGAVDVEAAGERWVAPLGPATLAPVAPWRLELAGDGWVELVAEGAPPLVDGVELVRRVTLLMGDELAVTRGATPVLLVARGQGA